ncbi:myelin expression factor 2-like isoform X2 [Daphnia pulex]|uniref:myelin expression factor 2-like isoform X2 n=1 Tax=Daphnia pulex TaxID=6669 RepID=UPI001EDD18DB|nr:myelin expression factor 2-like isoform X2 [Daphnia pulex]
MENTQEVKENERSSDVPNTTAGDTTKVENTEVVTTDKPKQSTPMEKSNVKKKDQEQEKGRSKDQQSVRERSRRGERSRGGRSAFKGSVYRPRSRPECRVHISNIPYEYRWQDLKDLFRSEVGEVSFVELFEDEYGKPRGSGIVEFEKLEHARIALEKMNRFELKGRRLIVKEDVDVERGADASASSRQESRNHLSSSYSSGREYGGDVSYSSGRKNGPGGGGGSIGTLTSPSSTRWSNTYGLSPQFLDSLGIPGPLIDRIFVANLDYKVDDAKLREVFRLAGKVVVAEVVKDRDGRSRGFGVLQMSHPVEAVQAISMFNNQMLYDRRMTVRMDRDAERLESQSSRSHLPEGLRSIGMGLGSRGDPLRDLPRGGFVAPQGRPSDSYSSGSAMNFSSHHYDRSEASVGDFIPAHETGFGQLGGTAAMGGQMERSVAGLPSMGSNQSMPNLSMGDYRMSNLGSGYKIGIESGSSMSLNGIADRSNPAPYGYQTENFSAKGSLSASVHDYERREAYGSYRTNQMTRGKQDYPTSTEYDAVSRMSARGPSPPTSSSLAPTSGSSKLSDTILVTNLPPNCSWQDLRDTFCEVGDVLFADIRAKGTGLVRFSSERDAQRACSMLNRTRMEGYTIEVNFY